jgi:PAS domain S-box-containing protein
MDATSSAVLSATQVPRASPSLLSTSALLEGVLRRVADAPDRLAAILDEYTTPLFAFTADRRILKANLAGEQFFGYGRNELDTRPTDDIVPPRFRQPQAPSRLASPGLTTIEIPCLRRDGGEVPTLWTFGCAPCPQGPIFVVLVRDRTQLLTEVDLLRRSTSRYASLLQASAAIVWISDAKGEFVEPQPAWQEYTGQSWDEHRGSRWMAAIHPDDRDQVMRDLVGAVRSDSDLFRTQGRIWSKKHRSWRAFQTRGVPVRNETGLIVEWVGALTDVSDVVAARERAEHLQVTATQLVGAATVTDIARLFDAEDRAAPLEAHGAALFVREGEILRLVGATGGIRQKAETLAPIPISALNPLAAAVRSGTAFWLHDMDQLLARFPGHPREALRSDLISRAAIPLVVTDECIGVLAVAFGTTRAFDDAERAYLVAVANLWGQALQRARLAEGEREAIRRALEAETVATRKKDEFLAMLGHELRNPLAPILTATSLIRTRGRATTRELEILERQGRHLVRLVDDLLDISRITSGKLTLNRSRVDLSEVVAQAIESTAPAFQARGVSIVSEIRPTALLVEGDRDRLVQVLTNLLVNASKFTASGKRVFVTSAVERTEAVIAVRDEGEGIALELLPRVFEIFTQGQQGSDRRVGGLGLDLAIARSIVLAHGGTIEATSRGPGQGATFTVRLRLVDERCAWVPESTNPSPAAGIAPARHRVLVVDDNEDSAEMLAVFLSELGYEPLTAGGALEALRLAREMVPDAAILDIGLPEMDGYELARSIRSELGPRSPKLIAVTGYARDSDRACALENGFVEHVAKPMDVGRLAITLRTLLASSTAAGDSSRG